jgi:hypothetical protein
MTTAGPAAEGSGGKERVATAEQQQTRAVHIDACQSKDAARTNAYEAVDLQEKAALCVLTPLESFGCSLCATPDMLSGDPATRSW